MRGKTFVVAIVALAALAGCSKHGDKQTNATGNGAGTNTTNHGSTVDTCSLLTIDEATAALGEQAKAGVPHSSQTTRQCQWDSANGSVAILVFVGGQRAHWAQTYGQSKQVYSTKFSDVPNLGDGAFSNGFDVHVLKGDDMYQIGVAGPFQDHVERAIAVAQEALARA